MTILNRLYEKGLVSRRREGRGDVYIATLTHGEYADARAAAQVSALVDQWGEVAFVPDRVDGLMGERPEIPVPTALLPRPSSSPWSGSG